MKYDQFDSDRFLRLVSCELEFVMWKPPQVREYVSPVKLWTSPFVNVVSAKDPNDPPIIRTEKVMNREMGRVLAPHGVWEGGLPVGYRTTCELLLLAGSNMRAVAAVWIAALMHMWDLDRTCHWAGYSLCGYTTPKDAVVWAEYPWHHSASSLQFHFRMLGWLDNNQSPRKESVELDLARRVAVLAVLNSNAWNIMIVRSPETETPQQGTPA